MIESLDDSPPSSNILCHFSVDELTSNFNEKREVVDGNSIFPPRNPQSDLYLYHLSLPSCLHEELSFPIKDDLSLAY